MVGLAGELELLVGLVHLDVAAAGHTALAHAAGHNGRVRGHAAAHGQDALSSVHALDVLRRGLQADQDHLLASAHSLASSAEKTTLPQAAPGEAARALPMTGVFFRTSASNWGWSRVSRRAGLDHEHGLLFVDHALVHQVDGDLQGGGGGALAVTGLEHIELAVLDGELHVLHVAIVVLQSLQTF